MYALLVSMAAIFSAAAGPQKRNHDKYSSPHPHKGIFIIQYYSYYSSENQKKRLPYESASSHTKSLFFANKNVRPLAGVWFLSAPWEGDVYASDFILPKYRH